MSDNSSIEWTEATWNPLLGCERVSPGCDSCYAINTATIRAGNPHPKVAAAFEGLTERRNGRLDWTGRINLLPDRLTEPLRWRKPKRIFVNSQADLFHDDVPVEYIAKVFAVMALAPQHTFQLLTKRHARMRSALGHSTFSGRVAFAMEEFDPQQKSPEWRRTDWWPLPNVWLGVSVENQQWADIRIPALLETPAAVRWISAEPLLGPVDLSRWLVSRPAWGPEYPEPTSPMGLLVQDLVDVPALSWVVAGGESGPGSRPMHPDWARGLRDQCTSASVPFFYKQTGQFYPVDSRSPALGDIWVSPLGATVPWEPGGGHVRNGLTEYRYGNDSRAALVCRARSKHDAGRLLDGRTWDEYPSVEPAVSR